ncbi:MAG: terminase family protein [Opitutales bacterium]|nr:terminase family protein [Opitutales bacterium]
MFFLPYQKRWLEDTSRLKLMVKSRQIGLSWTAAYSAVRSTAPAGNRLDTWVASRDEAQARLFLQDARMFGDVLHRAAPCLDERVRPSASSLGFLNGRSIHCLSSNADAQAGKRGHRILDEFALHPDPQHLYTIAYPGITWGGRLEIISTHRGSANYFNRLIEEIREGGNPKGFSLHVVTLPDALRQGFLKKLQAKLPSEDPRCRMSDDDYLQYIRDGCADEDAWNQEYLCLPSDDKTAFLSASLIASCEQTLRLPLYPREHTAKLFLGIDLARDHDLTVFYLLEQQGAQLLTRDIHCVQNLPFSEQEAILHRYMALPGLRRVAMDETGIGRQFAERATARYGRSKVLPVTLTLASKEQLAYPLRESFENGNLVIPEDPVLRSDLSAVRVAASSVGAHVRFTAERSAHGHADRFWALALALHAAQQVQAVPRLQTLASSRNCSRI